MSQLNPIQGYSATWVPVLKATTTDPSPVTYTTQVGFYTVIGNLCFFQFSVVTSSITKGANLTDSVRMSLPLPCISTTNYLERCVALAQNATPVQSANFGLVQAGNQFMEFRQLNTTADDATFTYAVATGLARKIYDRFKRAALCVF